MKKIKNIIFDMGGVLIDLNREACVDRFRELGFPQADELLNSYRQKGIFAGLELGTVEPDELYEYIAGVTRLRKTVEEINDALYRFLVGVPQYKLDLLLELKKNYHMGLLSNTNSIMFPYAVEKFFEKDDNKMDDYFDDYFLSYRMHMMKPDPIVFETLLLQGEMKPSETLFIDDAAHNVEAAAALGIRTLYAPEGSDLRDIYRVLE